MTGIATYTSAVIDQQCRYTAAEQCIERVTNTTRRLLYIAATLPPSISSTTTKQHHAYEVAHPRCAIATCMYQNTYHASLRIGRQTRARVHASIYYKK